MHEPNERGRRLPCIIDDYEPEYDECGQDDYYGCNSRETANVGLLLAALIALAVLAGGIFAAGYGIWAGLNWLFGEAT